MSKKPRPYHIEIPCHLIARGVAKQPIFLDDEDYGAFLVRLKRSAAGTKTAIMGFCPIWNHLHLLARRMTAPLGGFMSSLLTSYAQYFNLKYERAGHVFQNRFLLKRCLDNSYLKTVLGYIHLNPVKAKLVERVGDWRWSSHHDYMRAAADDWVDTKSVLGLFEGGVREYADLVGGTDLLSLPEPGEFLPSDEPVEEFELEERPPLHSIAAGEASAAALSVAELYQSRKFGATKAKLGFVLRAMGEGYSAAEISREIGCSKQAISMMLGRLKM